MLVLTVTRQCDLRCAYCRTPQDNGPTLTGADCTRALEIYVRRFGGGDVKLFGGEPLLAPDATRAAIEAAQAEPAIRRIYLSTNGVALDDDWLALMAQTPKLVLTLSLDGRPEDHDRFRRLRTTGEGSYAPATALLPQLVDLPRVVITQTIAPQTAARADDNLAHLLTLGFRRFNLLPVYYRPWTADQITALRGALDRMRLHIIHRWENDRRFYLRNLYTWSPTPFFNRGFVVDADRRIHPSNAGLWGDFEGLLDESSVGDLDRPPTPEQLEEASTRLEAHLHRLVPTELQQATRAVDAELTRLCGRLYPALVQYRRRKRGAA